MYFSADLRFPSRMANIIKRLHDANNLSVQRIVHRLCGLDEGLLYRLDDF